LSAEIKMLEEILKFEITEEGLVKLYDRFSFDELLDYF